MTRIPADIREVTLLTQPDCKWCEHAKKVLASVATDYPLMVTEIDLHTPEGQQLTATNPIPYAPGILLDGALVGFGRLSERALRRALKITPRHVKE
jgi:glutaredoxin